MKGGLQKAIDLFRIAALIVTDQLSFTWLPKKREKINILFIVPLYHTNMIAMVESLISGGHGVAVVVAKKEDVENYQSLRPILMSNSTTINQILKKLPFSNPDLVLVREHASRALELANSFQSKSVKIYHYNQKPLRRPNGWKHLIKDLKRLRAFQLKGVPLRAITPVDNVPHRAMNWPRKFLSKSFDFPVYNYKNTQDSVHSTDEPIQILLVGKMAQPRKRHFWLIDALRSSDFRCELNICGSGLDLEFDDGTRDEAYYWRLKEASLNSMKSEKLKIFLNEYVDFYELSSFYRKAEIFALPSTNEEFGISVIEAMAHSCAVVVSDACGAARHITDSFDGYIYPVDDYEVFEHRIHELLRREKRRKQMQENAFKTATKNHNYKQFEKFIQSIS